MFAPITMERKKKEFTALHFQNIRIAYYYWLNMTNTFIPRLPIPQEFKHANIFYVSIFKPICFTTKRVEINLVSITALTLKKITM